jgi:uncharacterized protein YhdP
MAMTMTRTPTQTTLTQLVKRLANVNGELRFLETTLQAGDLQQAHRAAFERRRDQLRAAKDAYFVSLLIFDPDLEPQRVAAFDDWLKPHGRGAPARRRYLASLAGPESK